MNDSQYSLEGQRKSLFRLKIHACLFIPILKHSRAAGNGLALAHVMQSLYIHTAIYTKWHIPDDQKMYN